MESNPFVLNENEKKYFIKLSDGSFWKILLESINDVKFLLPYFRLNTRLIILSFLSFLLGSFSLFLIPRLIGRLIDSYSSVVITQKEKFFQLFFILAVLFIARIIFEGLFKYLFVVVGQRVSRKLREDVFYKIYRTPQIFFDLNAAPRVLSRAVNDITQTESILNVSVFSIFKDLTMVFGAVVSAFFISPWMALPMSVVLFILLYALAYISAQGRVNNLRTRSLAAKKNASLSDYMNNQESVIAHQWSPFITQNFTRLNKLFYLLHSAALIRWATFTAIHAISIGFIQCSLLLLGVYFISQHRLSVGELVSCISYSAMMFSPFFDLSTKVQEILSGLASLGRLSDFFNVPDSVNQLKSGASSTNRETWWKAPIEIKFKDVYFTHGDNDILFENYSLTFEAGKATAIMGRTGSGKTTLINLLLRLYPLKSGKILLNGTSVDDFDYEEFYAKIAYVSQDLFVFRGSIRDNLKLGLEMSDEIILETLRKLQFPIENFENGLDFKVTMFGQEISTGQKQLIMLARILLKHPSIIILDEGTAHLDGNTESSFYQQLRFHFPNITMLVVAHREATLKYVDHIVHLDQR
ncbi:MAG: ABC transporter ATP-binding protein [Bacteriovoracaceae bacterium]|nr:ABC transporter ATP-binding protein [Bacteriovoracaceae bacterium]